MGNGQGLGSAASRAVGLDLAKAFWPDMSKERCGGHRRDGDAQGWNQKAAALPISEKLAESL